MNQCNCQPQNYPFSCQRGNCPLKDCRPEKFESPAQLEALRAGQPIPAPPAKVEPPPRLTPDEWPCVHRLEVLRQEGCGCGASKPKMDVFACSVHGECTINSPGKTLRKSDKSGRVAVCISCDDKA